ncbi:MAG TPA: 50S ribosomal protein L7ae [Thermoplasmata archaeon]|nr:50S ribosomal protein L7ae [Thermoplasmata archaeon]
MSKAYVRFEMPEDLIDTVYEAVEQTRDTGKLHKGTNEVTKVIERGHAVFVVMAMDVVPEEVVMHIPYICEEKNIPYAYVPSKNELGRAAGLSVSTASVAITKPGKAKTLVEGLSDRLKKIK